MKHLGDITKIKGNQIPIVDCICGGSPCQDLSLAGRRKGLAGERSGLFMEQIRIVKEMRKHDIETNKHRGISVRPRYLVWENVTGALSSGSPRGEDFRIVLEEICKVADESAHVPRLAEGQRWSKSGCIMGDGWSVAWRVHNSQFWGVPQRRCRISVIGDFGGESAPEVLFERKSMSRDSESSGETWKNSSEDASGRSDSTSQGTGTVKILNTSDSQGNQIADSDGIYPTLRGCGGAGYQQGYCMDKNIAFSIGNCQVNDAKSPLKECSKTLNCLSDPAKILSVSHGGFMCNVDDSGVTHTIQASDYKDPQAICYNSAISFQERAGKEGGGKGILIQNEKVGTLSTLNNQSVMPYDSSDIVCASSTNSNATFSDSYSPPLTARGGTGGGNSPMIAKTGIIRRITPIEAERLQGFPDGWTDIGDWTDTKGKKHKGGVDTPRYKALGNSIALPFWFWLLRRISAQYVGTATLGSLFDGIGGFPLCWERCNGKGSALWASEIEEFPIAVTKSHFPEE